MSGLTLLRVAALCGVVGAIIDPGCPRPSRPRLALAIVGEGDAGLRVRTAGRVRALVDWADIVDVSDATAAAAQARLVFGDSAAVLADLHEHPAALAGRLPGENLEVVAVHAPTAVVAGSRVPIAVRVRHSAAASLGRLRVRLVDAETGGEEASAEQEAPGGSGQATVTVPWVAAREGVRRLRLQAAVPGRVAMRPSPWIDVALHVRPAAFAVHVLEARPTWMARFARLALAAGGETRISAEVRTAPGLSVRRLPEGRPTGREERAAVLLASGLEALTRADVDTLEAQVRDAGRVLVLLMDGPPGPGPWRRLWPSAVGRLVSAGGARDIDVAGARWRAREWLTPVTSPGVVPLATVGQGRVPVVVARALGEGRVVLVAAVDAWRWRADPGVTWAEGWQSLLRRLAADVPPPVAVTAWVTGSGAHRVLQVEARIRRDVALAGDLETEGRVEVAGRLQRLPLLAVQQGRLRGGLRVRDEALHRVMVAIRSPRGMVAQGDAVVHVSPVVRAASWDDVAARQRQHGALAEGKDGLAPALSALRQRLVTADGPRWYVTRTWWYAALVVAALGSEWILRRARRLP